MGLLMTGLSVTQSFEFSGPFDHAGDCHESLGGEAGGAQRHVADVAVPQSYQQVEFRVDALGFGLVEEVGGRDAEEVGQRLYYGVSRRS